MTDIAKITTAITPVEETEKINEVIQRANENATAIAGITDEISPGMVMPYAGSTAPNGWLICDGSAISRTTYADLFAVIGTTYGAGDGSTTFNLPNFTNRVIQGGTVGTYKNAGLPNITGTVYIRSASYAGNSSLSGVSGAFSTTNDSGNVNKLTSGQASLVPKLNFNAQDANSIYGNSTTVQPPALCVNICIKY